MKNSHAILTESFTPRYDDDYRTLQELTEEILGYRGEFIMCDSCNIVLGKNEVFGHPEGGTHIKTIRELMNEQGVTHFSCTSCGKNMRFMYGEEYIDRLKKRFGESVENFLTVSRNQNNQIVGYAHCYVADFSLIFYDELHGHFRNIGIERVHTDIERILGIPVRRVYFKSFLGLKEEYTSPVNTFAQIQKTKFPIEQVPSIAEVDKNQNLYSIYKSIGGLEIAYDKEGLTDSSSNSHWAIIAFKKPSEIHKRYLSGGIRQYLYELRKKRKEDTSMPE